MIFKRYPFQLFLRLLVLVLSCVGGTLLFLACNDGLILTNLVVFLGLQVYFLVNWINRFHRDISCWFDALKFEDSGLHFAEDGRNIRHQMLNRKMEQVLRYISGLKEKKVQQDYFYQALLDQAPVPILVLDNHEHITMHNKAARKLFRRNHFAWADDLLVFHEDLATLLKGDIAEPRLLTLCLPDGFTHIKKVPVLMQGSWFKQNNIQYRMVAFQDVESRLQENEVQSWKRLAGILRHEMMNSIGPICSTIDTLKQLVPSDLKHVSPEVLSDVIEGMEIIGDRSHSLQRFVKDFKDLTRLPEPIFRVIDLAQLLASVVALFRDQMHEKNIEFTLQLQEEHVDIVTDRALLQQVLVNILRNAIEALEGIASPCICLRVVKTSTRDVLIQLEDNGRGLEPSAQEQVFTPFFTTKPDGSGIGLSLSRQLMYLLNGAISLNSSNGTGVLVTLSVPASRSESVKSQGL